jgi:hypothetical protein
VSIPSEHVVKNRICHTKLGDFIQYFYDRKAINDLSELNINSDVSINRNLITKKYTLLVPMKEKTQPYTVDYNVIALDLGLRTFTNEQVYFASLSSLTLTY